VSVAVPDLILVRPMRALRLVAFMAIVAGIARGDTPLPPPSKVTALSPNGAFRAVSEPSRDTRIEDVKQSKVLWRLPGWHRAMFVANDGKHVVTEYEGLNLIPKDFSRDLVLITFWSAGKNIKEITLGELFPDRTLLQQTVSHYAWGTVEGINSDSSLKVHLIDGRMMYFDTSSGKKIREELVYWPWQH
jgi:hypothetical protein